MTKLVELSEGDVLTVRVIPKPPEPEPSPEPEDELEVLITISGVQIFQKPDGSYLKFTSNLDICNDGTGPAHGDPYHQSQTAYYNNGKFLNADKDRYIVIPPQVRSLTSGVVMGCQAKLTNTKTGKSTVAVTGDIGPSEKTGEASYCAAKAVNPNIEHNVGDSAMIYLYELWPDTPAKVNSTTYKLEPA